MRWGTAHLELVTEQPEEATPPVPAGADRGVRAGQILASTVALSAVLALLGGQRWPLPTRVDGAVSAVPQSLVAFLLVGAAGCLWAAGRATRPATAFGSPAAAQVWWATVGAAAVVSVAADLSLAASAGAGQRPGDLMARWLVPAVPAVIAGVLARRDGRAARIRAALGTGVVTLPLFAVGWSLFASPAGVALAPDDVTSLVLLAGVTPFALAVAFVAAQRRG